MIQAAHPHQWSAAVPSPEFGSQLHFWSANVSRSARIGLRLDRRSHFLCQDVASTLHRVSLQTASGKIRRFEPSESRNDNLSTYVLRWRVGKSHTSEKSMGEMLQPWHLIVFAVVFSLIVVPFRVLPFWFICKKAGFSPWISLLYIVPLGGWVLNFVLAFADWKVIPAPQVYWPPQPPYPPPQSIPPQG